MLVIRNEQLVILSKEVLERFEMRMTDILVQNYPRECKQAGGRNQIYKLVQHGSKEAISHGYPTEQQASLFISLMFILGVDFVNDPQLPWVTEYLDEDYIADPGARIKNLFAESIDYLGATAGEDCELIVRAMIRIRKFDLSSAPDSGGDQWIEDVLEILECFYPEKFDFQGRESTMALIVQGMARAKAYGILSNRGLFVYIALMFMLGSGFDGDPLYPWARRVLNDVSIADESERVTRLHAEALEHISHSLSL